MSAPVITKPRALLIEGRDEDNFFAALFSHLVINDVQICQYQGTGGLGKCLKAFVLDPGFGKLQAFAIIRDADNSEESAFASVISALGNAGLHSPKNCGDFANKNKIKIGVYILPGESKTGMLEDLCLATMAGHPVMPHVETFFTSLGNVLKKRVPPEAPLEDGIYYFPKNESKARAQAFLSGQHESCPNLGIAATKKCWNFDHQSLAKLKGFINNLRTPV